MTWKILPLLFVISALCFPSWATDFRSGGTVSVPSDEVIDDDLIAFGNDVVIEGRVTGDVVTAGNTVRISGPVGGSVMAAGRQVLVDGEVAGSLRAVGQTVTLEGATGRNAALAGSELVLMDAAQIERDLHAAGSSLNLNGAVAGEAGLAVETASVRGRVGKGLFFEGDQLTIGPEAEVGGDLTYRSASLAQIAAGAKIGGERQQLPPRHGERKRRSPAGPAFLFALVVFVFGVVSLAAAPRPFTAAAYALVSRPFWNLFLGLVALVAVPIAAVIVCFTLVGIPIALLVLVAWVAALVFSGVPVGIFLGRRIASLFGRRDASHYLALFLGLLLLTVVGLLPYIGTLTKILTVLFGLGVYARAFKGVLSEMRRPAETPGTGSAGPLSM
jgi:cytoskeletal protein CcmA (bactofilin family)